MWISLWVLLMCYMVLFIIGYYKQDNSIVDVFWGVGFMILVGGMYITEWSGHFSETLMFILIILWWTRLSYYIGTKKLKKSWEDPRYNKWRGEWKYFYLRSFFQVYLLQYILMCIVAIPIFILYSGDILYNGYIVLLWVVLSLFGLIYESVADTQLRNFMQIKKQWEILTTGLRTYHRYPQYFGESIFWFGVSTIASQVSIWAFIGWVMVTFLVCFISGIPLSEARYQGNKKYAEYSQRTRAFFPKWWL